MKRFGRWEFDSTHAIIGANGDGCSSRLADHGAHLKDNKHSHYLHDGNAIGFAFDSMGGISQSANYIDHLYTRGEQEKRRRWDSETMRIALKKEILDRLSMVLCLHRVYDFKFLGIPNMRAEGAHLVHHTSSSSETSILAFRWAVFCK